VAITFDDGYADNYEYAFPLLAKWCIPAAFFVTVGLLEKDSSIVERFCIWRNGASYEDVRPLEWSQVKEMMRAGMEVGSHTYSHANLARLDPASAEVELRLSREILQDRLGERITMMAYPFGRPKLHFTRESVEVARRVGYEYGAAVVFRGVRDSDSPFAIPRFFVTRDEVNVLKGKILGTWDLLGRWHETAPLWLMRMLSRTLH
jgi:peptidoglycan/xylan/chitin deacetylase (PgdA/CDA1 family)